MENFTMKIIKNIFITATIVTCLTPVTPTHTMRNTDISQKKQELKNIRLAPKKQLILSTENERSQEELLDQLATDDEINHQNEQGETLLMQAIRRSNEPLVTLLLENYLANPRKADNEGITPLMAAVRQDNINLVNSVLISDENLNRETTDSYGNTPLLIAVRNSSFEIVRKLIASGANTDHRNNNGDTALMIATRISATSTNDTKMVQLLLDTSIVNICLADKDNRTPLDIALLEDRRELAIILLNHGAKPHDKNGLRHVFQFIDLPDDFATPLILAGADYENLCPLKDNNHNIQKYKQFMHIRDSFSEQNYELEDYTRERESFITELPETLINQGDDVIKLIGEYSNPYPTNINEISPEIVQAALAEMERRKKVRRTIKEQKEAQQKRAILKRDITPLSSKAPNSATATPLASVSAKTTSFSQALAQPYSPEYRNAFAQPQHAAAATRTGTIPCRQCTFENNAKNKNCEICLAPLAAQAAPAQQASSKKVSRSKALAADETIICSQCTFLNPASAEQCSICTAFLRDTSSDDEDSN